MTTIALITKKSDTANRYFSEKRETEFLEQFKARIRRNYDSADYLIQFIQGELV